MSHKGTHVLVPSWIAVMRFHREQNAGIQTIFHRGLTNIFGFVFHS